MWSLHDNGTRPLERRAWCMQDAYRGGRKAEAKQLSDRAKVEARRMDQANRAASEAAFDRNNNGRGLAANTVDLHGLYVKEALDRARSAIQKAKAEVMHLHCRQTDVPNGCDGVACVCLTCSCGVKCL